jgi:hypothetical protein
MDDIKEIINNNENKHYRILTQEDEDILKELFYIQSYSPELNYDVLGVIFDNYVYTKHNCCDCYNYRSLPDGMTCQECYFENDSDDSDH